MFILFSFFILFSRFSAAITENNVKAMFIFGDSLVDAGNKDVLETTAKCNYFPYGVDFCSGSTGRCTNGRTSADILGQLLGLPHLLPVFYDPHTRESSILARVNYTSVGAGILDSTDQSVRKSSLVSSSFSGLMLGADGRRASRELWPPRAYDFGARKFVVFNILQTGCNPYFENHNNGSCVHVFNEASALFNSKLGTALKNLSEDMPGFAFAYINASVLKELNASCCFLSESSEGRLCAEGTEPCPDRSIYAYYDGFHPTEKLDMQLATKAYSSELQSEAYPFNVEVLTNLNTSVMLRECKKKNFEDGNEL
ncbi:hypothetical protein EJ110_NYTH15728 [Nymphaea thermarum]|nr:hypothetical protein EJ110_NYTH15728 [Nymphaea thermarum]